MPPTTTSRNTKKNKGIGQANAGLVILLLVVFLAVLSFTLVIGFQSIVSVNEGHVVLSQLISQVEQEPFGLFFPDYDYDYYDENNNNINHNNDNDDHNVPRGAGHRAVRVQPTEREIIARRRATNHRHLLDLQRTVPSAARLASASRSRGIPITQQEHQ